MTSWASRLLKSSERSSENLISAGPRYLCHRIVTSPRGSLLPRPPPPPPPPPPARPARPPPAAGSGAPPRAPRAASAVVVAGGAPPPPRPSGSLEGLSVTHTLSASGSLTLALSVWDHPTIGPCSAGPVSLNRMTGVSLPLAVF